MSTRSKQPKALKEIRVDVLFSPSFVDELQLKDKNVVIIDVLRSSTSIVTALHNGAKEIIPVNDIESAVKISGSLFGDVTLRAGERNGKRIEGFNLGNSPLEYSKATVQGKSIIFLTSNGTGAVVKGRYAKNLVIGCFQNVASIVGFLATLREDVLMLCAGKENRFCLEDAVCAGKILSKLSTVAGISLLPGDGAVAAIALDKTYGKNVLSMLKTCDHGRYLTQIGYSEDLKICAQVDEVSLVPSLSGNVIRVRPSSAASAAKSGK